MINNSTINAYGLPVCLNDPFNKFYSSTEAQNKFYPSTDYSNNGVQQVSVKPIEKEGSIVDKSIGSSLQVLFVSEATREIYRENFDPNAATKLGVGQLISSTLMQNVDAYTENPVYRCMSHAAIQSVRNIYRGESILSGAISGAGYCITSEVSNTLKKEERSQETVLAAKILGTYATEILDSIPPCIIGPVACSASIAKGAVVASIVSGFHIYDYFTEPKVLTT